MLSQLLLKYRARLILVMSLYLLLVAMASISPLYLASLVDELAKASNADIRAVATSALLMTLASLLSMGIGFFLAKFLGRMSIDISTEMRTQILTSYFSAEQGGVPGTGEFMTAMLRDVSKVAGFITQDLGSILISVASFLGVSLVLIRMNLVLYAILLGFVPLFWLLYRRYAETKYRLARKMRQVSADLTDELTDAANHQRTIFLHRCQTHSIQGLQQAISHSNLAEYQNITLGAESGLALSGVSFVMNTLALLVGIVFVLKGSVSLGMLLAFTSNSSKLLAPVAGLTGIALSWQETRIALDNLRRYSSVPETSAQAPTVVLNRVVLDAAKPFVGELEFGVELDLPGVTSILGATGAGKSSLCAGLAGYLTPISGSISYSLSDGSTQLAKSVRDLVFLIDTNMQLFDRQSIYENLTLGHPIPEETIRGALRVVELEMLLLERGIELSQPVKGAGFSHGEAQRLLLARGILAEPQLLILDEALSGLDPSISERIMNRLKASLPSLIVVSHRPSDHQLSERSYLIDQGRIRLASASDGTTDA